MTPALTFGWVNGLCGAMTDMKLGLYMLTLMMGNQVDLVLQTYIGITIREATDAAIEASLSETELTEAFNSSQVGGMGPSSSFNTQVDNSNLETVSLVLRIALATLLVIGSTLWSR